MWGLSPGCRCCGWHLPAACLPPSQPTTACRRQPACPRLLARSSRPCQPPPLLGRLESSASTRRLPAALSLARLVSYKKCPLPPSLPPSSVSQSVHPSVRLSVGPFVDYDRTCPPAAPRPHFCCCWCAWCAASAAAACPLCICMLFMRWALSRMSPHQPSRRCCRAAGSSTAGSTTFLAAS